MAISPNAQAQLDLAAADMSLPEGFKYLLTAVVEELTDIKTDMNTKMTSIEGKLDQVITLLTP